MWHLLSATLTGIDSHSKGMDIPEGQDIHTSDREWYTVISAPPEDIDWLSPVTSSYILCATKSGKVVFWDVQTDSCLTEWSPGERWQLWKCRVEIEQRAVFFMMGKVMPGSYDDGRIMDFVLMKLQFPDKLSPPDAHAPALSKLTDLKITGVVMNVFLLDPSTRVLSAFVWVSTTNTIGLYVLPDWDKSEYVYIDTGIECVMTSNWSCFMCERSIVIHCEGSDAAFQYFYPLSLLQAHMQPLDSPEAIPELSGRVVPSDTLKKTFIFPVLQSNSSLLADASAAVTAIITEPTNPNPFPSPLWYPECAHFVRQWWTNLPKVPQVNSTVVLLASYDRKKHQTRFVLVQHYFQVPLSHADWIHGIAGDKVERGRESSGFLNKHMLSADEDRCLAVDADKIAVHDALMHMSYVSTPFEVVHVMEEDSNGEMERPRPLLAVDFGYAAWIEYEENESGEPVGHKSKALRLATFPPFIDHGRIKQQDDRSGRGSEVGFGKQWSLERHVRTLEIPDGLKLDCVETIHIDQSQGAVILSVKEKDTKGRMFILSYESV